jgi:hypothetical protein
LRMDGVKLTEKLAATSFPIASSSMGTTACPPGLAVVDTIRTKSGEAVGDAGVMDPVSRLRYASERVLSRSLSKTVDKDRAEDWRVYGRSNKDAEPINKKAATKINERRYFKIILTPVFKMRLFRQG